jgi:hypothetical protein
VSLSKEQKRSLTTSALDKYYNFRLISYLQRALDTEEYEEAVIYRNEL